MFEKEGSKRSKWTQELLHIIAVCKTVEYRRAALQSLVLSKYTLPYILKKARDVKEMVRCAVFEKLRVSKVRLEQLKFSERVELVYSGLTDRSERVRAACQKFLQDWMQSLDLVQPLQNSPAPTEEERRRTRLEFPESAMLAAEIPLSPALTETGKPWEQERAIRLLQLFDVVKLKNDEEHYACLPLLVGFLAGTIFAPKDLLSYYKSVLKPRLMSTLESATAVVPSLEARQQISRPRASAPLRTNRPSNESLVLLRLSCEHWMENRAKFADALLEIDDVLPDVEAMHRIIRAYVGENDPFAAHELMLLLPFYNYAEPKVGQQLRMIIDDLLTDVSLEESSFNLITSEDVGQQIRHQRSTLEENEGISSQYAQLISDQLDLQRRDVIVRQRRDLILVAIRVMRQLMSNDSNQFKEKIKMHIADFIEEIKDLKARQERLASKLEEGNAEANARIENEVGKLALRESFCLMRALKLAVGLLQTCKVEKAEPFLQEFQDTLVRDAFDRHHDNELLNFLATLYMSLYAIVDIGKCEEFIQFFRGLTDSVATTQTLKSVLAVKSIFDFYMTHGLKMEEVLSKAKMSPLSRSYGGATSSLLHEVQLLLYAPNPRVRLLVYEGFAKLMFCEKLPRAEMFIVPLALFLGDPTEEDGTADRANPIRQILTLAFNRYTRLSLSRCKKLGKSVVLLTLLWVAANSQALKIEENTMLHRFVGYKYQAVVGPLIYRLTHAYIGKETFVNLGESKDNPVAEIVVMLLSDLDEDLEILPYIQSCLALCLRFIDLDNIKPETLIVLYNHWRKLMEKLSTKEREYYALETQLKLRIMKLVGKELTEEEVKEDEVSMVTESYKETCAALTTRLRKRYTKAKKLRDRLVREYAERCIDPTQGCYVMKRKTASPPSPTTVREGLRFVDSVQRRMARESCTSDLELETPKRANALASRKRKRLRVPKNEEAAEPSGKVVEPVANNS